MPLNNRILFNDLILFRSNTGVSSVARQFLKVFPQVEKELKIDLLSDLILARPFARSQKMAQNRTAKTTQEGSGWKRFLSQGLYSYSRYVLGAAYRPNIFHDPDLLALPIGKKRIATIHDLSVLLFPQWHPEHRVLAYKKYFKKMVDTTDHFFSVSETSKKDFMRLTGTPPEKITVTLNAPNPQYQPIGEKNKKAFRDKWSQGKQYFLFVSTLEPRKNVLGLLKAWEKMPASFRSEYQLLLVGGYGWKSSDLAKKLEGPEVLKSVKWLGSLDTPQLVECVGSATALVYPSFYEGFGLPPVEAMACGVPVISSDKGALKETVGEAAWIIDPNKIETIQEAMAGIAKNPVPWQQKGLVQAKKFHWEDFARSVASVYRQLLSKEISF